MMDFDGAVWVRVVERGRDIFVLDVGDPTLRAEVQGLIERGLVLTDGRVVDASAPDLLDHLAAAYRTRGWTVEIQQALTQHGTSPKGTPAGPQPTRPKEPPLRTLYPVDTFTPLDSITERLPGFSSLLGSVDETVSGVPAEDGSLTDDERRDG